MKKKTAKVVSPWEECASAIKRAKAAAVLIHPLADKLRETIEALDKEVTNIQRLQHDQELATVRDRIERKLTILRSMEPGSFMLEANRILDDAWTRLP